MSHSQHPETGTASAKATPPVITLVAAVDRNHVIGVDNRLPWHLPADLQHFKAITYGHPVIMGRKTYESIGRALPGRTTIVITRRAGYDAPGCVVVHSLEAALACARESPGASTICIIGGGEIFAATIGLAGRLDLTEVDATMPRGDAYFPPIDPAAWQLMAREPHAPDERNPLPYAFVTYCRRR